MTRPPPPPWPGPPTVVLRYAEVETAMLPMVDAGPSLVDTRAVESVSAAAAPAATPTVAEPPATPTAAGRLVTTSGTAEPPISRTATESSVAPAMPPRPVSGHRGWWRRNRWGLLTLLPALVLAIAPGARDGYERYSQAEYRDPVRAGTDGWVTFSGARIRLVELVRENPEPPAGSRPLALSEGVVAWRATLTFELSTPDALIGCQPHLEDRDGRLFGPNAAELRGARLPIAGCDAEDPAQRSFRSVVYFALPRSATPVALRILRATERPRYARLTVG
ncbi:hypothetical protein ACN28C_29605 [Plantactinospora sp. WMMC1484]|uniref:hypothetical protein n=1 Tax=Plantactinospora sp. WMMC1484 TaxID=3404122 RepID=UPI003BF56962